MILSAFLRDCGKEQHSEVSIKSCLSSFNKKKKRRIKRLKNDVGSIYPNIIWRHGLQVVLEGLSPFDGRLELVHFDQVICGNEGTNTNNDKWNVNVKNLIYQKESHD